MRLRRARLASNRMAERGAEKGKPHREVGTELRSCGRAAQRDRGRQGGRYLTLTAGLKFQKRVAQWGLSGLMEEGTL